MPGDPVLQRSSTITMPEENDNPAYDEPTLAKLLEAAYVLQEHNRELKKRELKLEVQRDQFQARQESSAPLEAPKPVTKADYTAALAQIVDTQHQIQARQLKLDEAAALVAERLIAVAGAGGAAIGFLDGKLVRYRTVSGKMTPSIPYEVGMDKALCVACLRTGQVVRCPDVNAEFLLDVEECQKRGIQSMIAVPIYHDERASGGLELYFDQPEAFTEQDVHSCQLMAGLLTEVMTRDDEHQLKTSVANERAVVLEALEKLKPNLAALAESPAAREIAAKISGITGAPNETDACRKCGQQIRGKEQFCGKCGTPRGGNYESSTMQSKVAALWQMQEAIKDESAPSPQNGASPFSHSAPEVDLSRPEKTLADSIEEEMPELFASVESRSGQPSRSGEIMADVSLETLQDNEGNQSAEEIPAQKALVKQEHAWSSAVTAREFLEQFAGAKRHNALARFWDSRRGDIYLAIAILFVAAVIRWGIWSNHSVDANGGASAATARHKTDPNADLSWFDRMLIDMGIAEAPPVPEYKGNPDAQVWVDLHTALYYCPGADLYGKTPKGKYTTQREAQLDQFESASRKACD